MELKKMWFRTVEKLCDALTTFWGWVLVMSCLVAEFIGGHDTAIMLVLFSVILDAIWGITASIIGGRFALSELARDTIGKLAVYGTALFMFISVDKIMIGNTTVTASVVSALIILVECWSACANMLICFPKMPFLRIMQRALKGEIARKLNIPPERVDEALGQTENNSYDNNKKQSDPV